MSSAVQKRFETSNQTLFYNVSNKTIKSPLNYIGGKQKLLKQILPLFPTNIDTFVDLFAGGCNVGINVNSEKVWFNDNLSYLIDMYKAFQSYDLSETLSHINDRINKFELSLTNDDGYKKIREHYNKYKHPLDLFVLVAFSFNHQIRFNNNHQFNNPFGKERSSFNPTMKQNLIDFVSKIKEKEVHFFSSCFEDFDFSFLNSDDFVYCDPPYLITTGTYNDGKRGFKGWGQKEELGLLKKLDHLNNRNIRFALSNVLEHKGKSNDILKLWIKNNPGYEVHYMNMHYSNSSYNTLDRSKNGSIEVLITNYSPDRQTKIFSLCDTLN